MTLLQLLSFAFLAITSYPLVSARNLQPETAVCTASPLEWCSDFITASNCDAVNFCIISEWSELKVSSDDSCQTCVNAIENIRKGVGSNVTKEIIQEALDAVCEMTIFTQILRKQCEEVINTYIDSHLNDLLDLLKSDIDPRTVCKLVDLCARRPTETDSAELVEFAVRVNGLSAETDPAQPGEFTVRNNGILLHFPGNNQFFEGFDESPERPLVGSYRCTWGPSYWCGNLTTSKECASTTHCIEKYWSQKEYEEDNDSVCQVCKDMVKQARDQLLSNETQEELKEVFEGSCKLIPLREVRGECIKLADEFVPELTEVLASQMNPTAVCTVAGLCNSPRIDNLLANAPKNSVAVDLSTMNSCVNCTAGLTFFQRYVQSSTKKNILSKVLTFCGEMSSFSDLCHSLVVSNFDDIYGVLNTPLPPFAYCHLSGMCSYQYHTHMVFDDDLFIRQVHTMVASTNDDLPCDLCKQLVHHLQEMLISNTTEDEFQQMLLGMCQQTGTFKDECTKLVNENFKLIYKFLTEELDPPKICAEIQICPRSKNFVSDDGLNLITGVEPVELPTDAEPAPSQEVAGASSAETNVDSIECKLCHSFVKIIQKELDDPKYEHDVEKVLEEVCTLVPKANRERCDEFIDEYADTLIKILADETDPFEVCRMLKICPSSKSVSDGSIFCPFCQYLLHFIQEALQDPHDTEQIEDVVKKVCNIVPRAEKSKCDQFISQYSALIITILSQEVDPSLVCPALKVCPASSSPTERCNHCQLFMTDLIGQLENRELDHVKETVSSLNPRRELEKSVTALQMRFADREGIIDMMVAEFDADESCVFLKLCGVQNITDAPLPVPVVAEDIETNEIIDNAPSVPRPKPYCAMCQLFVKMYEKEMDKDLKKLFEEFCEKVDKQFKENCTHMADEAVSVFTELLKKKIPPGELCNAAGFCSMHSRSNNIDSECRACEVAVGSMESVLSDPLVREDVFEQVIKICDVMTGRSRMICEDVISQLLPEVQGIVFDIPPWFVCSKLKVCPYGKFLDTSVCSNPQLWCQDKETAFLCNRLNFCHVNAWSSSIP